MALSEKLKKLARIVPGVAGYQDMEKARDTDKAVRMRLSAELEEIKLDLEKVKKVLMGKTDLSLLPSLDSLTSKLDKTGNLIKFASRGYSGIFDTNRADSETIAGLYTFDLSLFDKTSAIKSMAGELLAQSNKTNEATILISAIAGLGEALDSFEKHFRNRQEIYTKE